MRLTAAGATQARHPTGPVTSRAIHERLEKQLTGPEWRILKTLIEAYPGRLTRDEVARGAGYSATSTSFTNPLSALHVLRVISYPERGMVVAEPVLFVRRRG